MKLLKYLSYNVGSNSNLAGLHHLLSTYKPLFVFLQEVTITTNQLNALLNKFYVGECNIDDTDPRKPGTAIIWFKSLPVTIFKLVERRIQGLKVNNLVFLNVYGAPGTQGQRDRKLLFREKVRIKFSVSEPYQPCS